MSKRIVGVDYENDKIAGITVDGLNDGTEDSAYFRREIQGRWIRNGDAPTYESPSWWNGTIELLYYDCSECGATISDRYGTYLYCPYCGAKMEDWS